MPDQWLPTDYSTLSYSKKSTPTTARRNASDALKKIKIPQGIHHQSWYLRAKHWGPGQMVPLHLKRLHDRWDRWDNRSRATVAGKESQSQWPCTRWSRHPSSILPENLPSPDWPCQPSAHLQKESAPAALGWLKRSLSPPNKTPNVLDHWMYPENFFFLFSYLFVWHRVWYNISRAIQSNILQPLGLYFDLFYPLNKKKKKKSLKLLQFMNTWHKSTSM